MVIDFCRQNAHLRVIPVRGDDAVKAQVYRRSRVDETVTRYHLNTVDIKDRLYRLLFETAAPGPGFFHLHRDTSAEVKAHLCSEEQRVLWHGTRKEVVWRPKKGAGPNHLWDCCVYATAAAEIIGVGRLAPVATRPTRPPERRATEDAPRSGGFLDNLPRMHE
jgi:phage terminase large subunit GpA-like protein